MGSGFNFTRWWIGVPVGAWGLYSCFMARAERISTLHGVLGLLGATVSENRCSELIRRIPSNLFGSILQLKLPL